MSGPTKTLVPGKFIARPLKAQFGQSAQKGTLGCAVLMEIDLDKEGSKVTQWYTCWLSAGALEFSIKTLALLGLTEKVLDNYGVDQEIPGTAFDGNDVQVTVENESYEKNGETKIVAKIKWINEIGGGSGFANADAKQLKNQLLSIGLKEQLAAARAEIGKTSAKAAPKAGAAKPFNHAPGADNSGATKTGASNNEPSFDQNEDVPF